MGKYLFYIRPGKNSFLTCTIAIKDVITAAFNRRDDAFSFLAYPELNAESFAKNGHNSSGNYGILDYLELLKWV